jgi:hypothetical protein
LTRVSLLSLLFRKLQWRTSPSALPRRNHQPLDLSIIFSLCHGIRTTMPLWRLPSMITMMVGMYFIWTRLGFTRPKLVQALLLVSILTWPTFRVHLCVCQFTNAYMCDAAHTYDIIHGITPTPMAPSTCWSSSIISIVLKTLVLWDSWRRWWMT